MKKFVYILWAALLFGGCTEDYYQLEGEVPVAPKLVDVDFEITMPRQAVTPVSRADFADDDVENIDVLVFGDSDQFLERIEIDPSKIQIEDRSVTFGVSLYQTTEDRTFHIVVNGRDAGGNDRLNFDEVLIPDEPMAYVMTDLRTIPGLTESTVSRRDFFPMIMWGQTEKIAGIGANTSIENVSLLKMAARIDVVEDTATSGNGLASFEIVSITLHGAAKAGYLLPYAGLWSGSGTIPETPHDFGGNRINYYHREVSGYEGYFDERAEPYIYLYDRENMYDDQLSLIIGARWNGTMGYYRVLFSDEEDPSVSGDLVRSHRYIATVVKAWGAGHATIEAAMANPPANLRVTFTDYDEELHFLYANGNQILGASHNELKLFGLANVNSVFVQIAKVYSEDKPVIVSNVEALSALSFGPIGTNTWMLYGKWKGVTGSGEITVSTSNGQLKHTIYVNTYAQISQAPPTRASVNAASYYRLFNNDNRPWSAEVTYGTNKVRLDSNPNQTYAGGEDFGQSYLDYKTSAACYVYWSSASSTWIDQVNVEAGYMDPVSGKFRRSKNIFVFTNTPSAE